MKKKCIKLLKFILAILPVVAIVVVFLKVYSQTIIFDIVDSMRDYSAGEFAYKVTYESFENSEKDISEYIKNENVYVTKYDFEDYIQVKRLDLNNTNEFYNYCEYHYYVEPNHDNMLWLDIETLASMPKMEYLTYSIYASDIRESSKYFDSIPFWDKVQILASLPIIYTKNYEGKDCYVFNNYYGGKTYIDKENLLPVATSTEFYLQKFEYNIKYDKKILEEPDMSKFSTVDYLASHKIFDISYEEISENPISATDLAPTETLIETVELKENEILDVLPITGEAFGVKRIDIYGLELYNKFRKVYSNLRELTEEDFKYYTAYIIYKNGYELTYSDTKEPIEGSGMHYIFSEKESKTDSIVLIVKPRANKGNFSVAICNEKLPISANQIEETYFEASNEIEENLGLDKDVLYCANADLDILKNEEYQKFDYVKTSIKEGTEPICWKIKADIQVRKEYYGDVYTYIDAITGEVIGARYIRNND